MPLPGRKVIKPLRWSYGITTVASRREDPLPATIDSLIKGGFNTPRLFVDGDANGVWYANRFQLDVTCRGGPPVRTAGNWVSSLVELFHRDPTADRYAVFQDDLECVVGLREYLEDAPYPTKGYLNLFTVGSNSYARLREAGKAAPQEGATGFYPSNQRGKGALALVFDNEAVAVLLSAQHLVNRTRDVHRGFQAIDGGVVDSMRQAGYLEYVHCPSLVRHTGVVSTLKHDCPNAHNFPGTSWDARSLLQKPA